MAHACTSLQEAEADQVQEFKASLDSIMRQFLKTKN